MGWTYNDWNTKEEAMKDEWYPHTIVECSFKGDAGYAAVLNKDRGYVFASVCLFDESDGQIGIKVMEESMGPVRHDCSKAVFEALTPLEEIAKKRGTEVGKYEKLWREQASRLI